MKQHILQSSVHGDDDLNVEHLQLLLLLFHNMSERGRRSVLTLVTQAIMDVAQNRDSQLKAVPLNLARLCLVFDYLLRHYSKAPLYLFEQVNFSYLFWSWMFLLFYSWHSVSSSFSSKIQLKKDRDGYRNYRDSFFPLKQLYVILENATTVS